MRRSCVNRVFLPVNILLLSGFLLTCGIEEYYYLPQVPQGNITRIMNTDATVNIPPIPSDYYHYANNYIIFYRIYISGQRIDSEITGEILNSINPDLLRDFDTIFPSSDPTNTSSGTAIGNLFRSRRYYELEVEGRDIRDILSKDGGKLTILFPTAAGASPELTFNDGPKFPLFRSTDGGIFTPEPDRYFLNSAELNDNANATATKNADVTGSSSSGERFAYVSMYIVAAGITSLFTPVYSKPTHISIFKLPDM